MRRSNNKGFTIVELVIVIAVIAILAAVLIPTIAGLVRAANVSSDTQLVKNLNTALASESVEGIEDALAAAEKYGYDVAKINASAIDNEILWDSANNVFCYFNADDNGKITYIGTAELTAEASDYWVIDDAVNAKFNTYLHTLSNTTVTAVAGLALNVGECEGVTVEVKGEGTFTITTNGGDLLIDNDQADVYHHGDAKTVTINAVKNASYHVFGTVAKIDIAEGHIVFEKGSNVTALVLSGKNDDNGKAISITVEDEAVVEKVLITADRKTDTTIAGIDSFADDQVIELEENVNVDDAIVGVTKFAGGQGTESDPYTIANAEQFLNIGSNKADASVYYKLTASIDMSAVAAAGKAYINGVTENVNLDLNGNSINNVAAYLFTNVANLSVSNGTIGFNGNAGVVNSATSGVAVNLSYSDLTITGALDVTSSHYGSLLSYAYLRNEFDTVVSVNNVIFSASINNTSNGAYSGSLVGYLQGSKAALAVNNCTMNGSVQSAYAAGFVGGCSNAAITSAGNTVNGTVLGSSKAQSFGGNDTMQSNAVVTVSEYATVIAVPASTDLYDGDALAMGEEFKINHQNVTITNYIVTLEYWVNRNSDGSGGYPRYLTVNVDVTAAGEYSTGLYKNVFEQIDAALAGDADLNTSSAQVWVEDGVYKVFDEYYTISSNKYTIRVAGYNASDVLVTYQNYTYVAN